MMVNPNDDDNNYDNNDTSHHKNHKISLGYDNPQSKRILRLVNDINMVRIVARRQKILNRTDHLSGNKIWLMLGIKVTRVGDIEKEQYCKPVEHNPPNRPRTQQISR